jgi:uncharacterized membrane protein
LGRSTLIAVVILIFFGSLLIRLANLDVRSLWIDEGASVANAQEDISTILASRQDDKHPPGYYAMLHYVVGVDGSEGAVRLPSAIASALTAVLIYLIGRRLIGHYVGFLAAALSMFSPLDVWYAQEARQPVLAAFFVMLAAYGLARQDWGGGILALIGLVAGLYTDYLVAAGWVIVSAVWTFLWWRRDRSRVVACLAISVIGFLAFAPIQGAHFWNGFSVLQTDVGAGIWYGAILGSNPVTANPLGILATIFLLGLGGSFLVGKIPNRGKATIFFAVLISAVVGLAIALMPIPRAFSVKKIIIVGWPLLLLFVSYLLLTQLASRRRVITVVALLTVSVVASAITIFVVPKEDWRSAVAYVNANAAPGDVAWVNPDPWAPDVYHYYEGKLVVMGNVDPGAALAWTSVGDVWVITQRRPQDPIPNLAAEAWFDDHWRLVEEFSVYRLAVRRYEQP